MSSWKLFAGSGLGISEYLLPSEESETSINGLE